MSLFVIKDGEKFDSAYARLDALRVKIQGLGCEKYNDGFDVNDEFIKGKIIEIVSPDEQQLSLIMHFMDSHKEMSPDDLVSFYVANENRVAQANKTRELSHEVLQSRLEGQCNP